MNKHTLETLKFRDEPFILLDIFNLNDSVAMGAVSCLLVDIFPFGSEASYSAVISVCGRNNETTASLIIEEIYIMIRNKYGK